MKYCCVLCTVPSLKKAREIAGLLVSGKVAACVSILPGLESHYRWRGKRETSKEFLLLIKTQAPRYKKLEKVLLKHHPYEVPEILCLPITQGNGAYLRWIDWEIR